MESGAPVTAAGLHHQAVLPQVRNISLRVIAGQRYPTKISPGLPGPQLAVQIAKLSGAHRIVAAGRNAGRLAGLPAAGATCTVSLDGEPAGIARELGRAAGDVDVVIDYLWGQPATAAMIAVVTGRADRGKPLTWIEIGSIAGPAAQIPSAALRAARLTIVGSGQGSVSVPEYLAELPALAEAITSAHSTSTPGPSRSPTSNKHWPPPARPSASSSPRSRNRLAPSSYRQSAIIGFVHRADETAASLLRRARFGAGMSQAELAFRAGVAQSVISAYEAGRRQPSLPTLAKLIDAAGCDLVVDIQHQPPQLSRLSGPVGRQVRRKRREPGAGARGP